MSGGGLTLWGAFWGLALFIPFMLGALLTGLAITFLCAVVIVHAAKLISALWYAVSGPRGTFRMRLSVRWREYRRGY